MIYIIAFMINYIDILRDPHYRGKKTQLILSCRGKEGFIKEVTLVVGLER